MKNVLVTGGAGYVGSSFVAKLSNQAWVNEVTVLDNLSRKNYEFFSQKVIPGDKLRFLPADLLDTESIKTALKGIDIVYHLAARITTPFATDDPHAIEQVNHWGTANLVSRVEEFPVEQFVYLSSASVYGLSDQVIDEETPVRPLSAYGFSKLRGEQHVLRLFGKIKVHILRAGNVFGYGPAIRMDAVINRFLFEAHFMKKIQIEGSGEQKRSFLSLDLLTNTLVHMADSNVPSGTFNLHEHNLSINQLAETIQKICPDLERYYINSHLKTGSLNLAKPSKLSGFMEMEQGNLLNQLENFRASWIG